MHAMSVEAPIGTSAELGERVYLGKQIINLMGPEGCGKTVISKKLAAESGMPRVVFGDIFRDLAANDLGPFGNECRTMFAEHRYMKPRILAKIITDIFRQEDLANGFIIDGAMRTVGEVKTFNRMLKKAERVMPVANVLLRVPGWMGIERILKGASARNRPIEDSINGTLGRMSNYYSELGKRASLIQKQPDWRLIHIDGIGTPDEVFTRVRTALTENIV
jgi:adenylate kinase family enzyme